MNLYDILNVHQNEFKEGVLENLPEFPADSRKGRVIFHVGIKSLFVCINGKEDGADTTLSENWRVGRVEIGDLYSGSESAEKIIVTDGTSGFIYRDYRAQVVTNLTCTTTTKVREAVYISADDTVKRAKADSIASARVFGFVTSKQSTTKCTVMTKGLLSGFTGLVAGKTYFLDPSTIGAITTTPPSGSGQILLKLGRSLNSTTLYVDVDTSLVIRV